MLGVRLLVFSMSFPSVSRAFAPHSSPQVYHEMGKTGTKSCILGRVASTKLREIRFAEASSPSRPRCPSVRGYLSGCGRSASHLPRRRAQHDGESRLHVEQVLGHIHADGLLHPISYSVVNVAASAHAQQAVGAIPRVTVHTVASQVAIRIPS